VKSDSIIQTIAEMFSALSDLMRLKILIALSQSELCVCEIARLTGLSPFVTSHQLRFLRTLLIVKYQCSGKYAYYSLDDDYVLDMIRLMADHRQEGRQ
jgi:DNA-binding transcriptional ArsR family regulator